MLSVLKTTTPLANPVAKTPIQILLDLRPVRQTTASRRRHQIVQPASLHPGSGKPVHSTARARPPFPSELEDVPALSGTPRGGPPRARRSSSSRKWSSWARSRTCRRRRRGRRGRRQRCAHELHLRLLEERRALGGPPRGFPLSAGTSSSSEGKGGRARAVVCTGLPLPG